ncbi:MAG: hypothetical protein ACPG1A_16135 [Halioglobus sp.]
MAGWLTLLWQACPDTSIVSYASTQRVMLATLVGLSALAMVLRVVDRVPVLWHGASLMVRALCLGIVGVHVFLEASAPVGTGAAHGLTTVQAAVCQSEESEAVRAAHGLLAAVAIV